MDSLIIVTQKPREFLTDAANPHVDFISGSHKMVLKGGRRGRGTKGKKHEGRRMELWNGQGSEREGKDAGWQADGCPVYWFIRWFSHDVLSGHETNRRFSLC